MKVGIVGYGTMGKILEDCLKDSPFEIGCRIDPHAPGADFTAIDEESAANFDVCICFTTPESALDVVRTASNYGKNMVIATTGWLDSLEEVRGIIKESGNGLVYSSNFSIGVNLFFRMIEFAAKSVNSFSDYDVLGYEMHHRRKIDSPSGTAKTLENIVLENFPRKKKVAEDKLDRRIEEDEFHFASIRGGDIPGTHAIRFDSVFDSIELKHTARSRIGFAKGAIVAANWIQNRKGVFTEKEVMDTLLGEKQNF